MLHKDKGYEILDKIVENLEDLAKVEQHGRLTGRRMKMLIVPK